MNNKIKFQNGVMDVPDRVCIPYIEGDGIGVDITPPMISVLNAAISKAYNSNKEIIWTEIYAGEKAYNKYNEWLPQSTLDSIKEHHIAIKGPLTTPVGKGIRSLNVALRHELDLFVCLRPVRYFDGVVSNLKNPELLDVVIFRENSEDIYSGIEWSYDSPEAKKVIDFLINEMNVTKIRFPKTSGIGIKPISEDGSKRLIRAAIKYAIDNNRSSVSLIHKGNIMKFTEGAFRDWGYEIARNEYSSTTIGSGPWQKIINPNNGKEIIIKDVIADAFFQQLILRPDSADVIATTNLNGDYISDAAAAQVGGIGVAPGANIGDGVAIFEATHGTAPKYAGLDKVNPSSLILSGEMMLRYMGWVDAADLIISAISKTISNKTVTYDLARPMNAPTELSCSNFAKAIISNM